MNKIIQTDFNNTPASILYFRKIIIVAAHLTFFNPAVYSVINSFIIVTRPGGKNF